MLTLDYKLKLNSNSLLNKTIIYSIGNIATKGLSFILVFVTTFYLSSEEVGEYDLFLTTISLLTPVFTLQLTDAILRWLIENDSEENKIKVLSSVSFIVTFFTIILSSVIYLMSYKLKVNYVEYLILILFFQSYFLIFQQFQRATKDNKGYVLSSIIYTLVYVLFSIVFLILLKYKVEGLLIANCISAIFTTFFIILRNKIFNSLKLSKVDKKLSKELLFFSLPLIPNNLSWWAISSANRYFILFFIGVSANGVFAISYKFPTILMLLLNVFYLAWQEKAIESVNNNEKETYYSTTLEKFIVFVIVLSILLLGFNKLFIKYFVGADFYESWKYVSILLLAIIFNALSGFYGSIFYSVKNTKSILFSSFLSSIIVVVLSAALIPFSSLYGASIAILIGYMMLFFVRYFQMKKYLAINFPKKIFIQLISFFLIIGFLEQLNQPFLIWVLPLISIILAVYYLKETIKTVFYKIF